MEKQIEKLQWNTGIHFEIAVRPAILNSKVVFFISNYFCRQRMKLEVGCLKFLRKRPHYTFLELLQAKILRIFLSQTLHIYCPLKVDDFLIRR